MYKGFSMFSTTRQVSRSTEPGFKYFSEGPLISALASAKENKRRGIVGMTKVQDASERSKFFNRINDLDNLPTTFSWIKIDIGGCFVTCKRQEDKDSITETQFVVSTR